MSGYEVATGIERIIGNFWSTTTSQVYRELRSLETAGLIELDTAGPRERRICAVTAAGRAAFKRWIARDPGDRQLRDPFLLAVFFREAIGTQTLARFVRQERAKHEQRLANFEQVAAQREQARLPPEHVLRFAIMFEKTRLEWLDSLPWK